MLKQTLINPSTYRIDETLVPPTVAIALNEAGLLPVGALSVPVPITFAAWPDVNTMESYQVLWNAQPAGPIKFIEATNQPGDILTLDIPVSVLLEGKHQIAYLVTNTSNNTTSQSLPTPIEVDLSAPGNPLIAPIIFPPVTLDGLTGIELEAMGNVLQGTIASYNGMAQFDVIQTYWNGIPGPVAVVDADAMGLRRVVVDFSRAFLETIGDIEAPVYYTVTDLAGNLSMDAAQVLVRLQLVPVVADLVFDTTPATLDGKVYLMPGAPDLLPAFPAGTTLQRVASGGQPPYTYSSSDNLVAVVDGTGLASVRGKGAATISVTDSLGASSSYALTVTGVIHCVGLGGGSFPQMEAAAAGQGARVPSLQELNEIHAAYGDRWPMGGNYFWSSTVHSYALFKRIMHAKVLVTGATAPYGIWDLSSALGVGIR